jgi:hypothetical protein
LKEETLDAGATDRPAEVPAPAATASGTDDAAPGPRRRVPAIVLGLGGAIVAGIYGVAVMHMRMGAPLVVLALGGMTLVLAGVALWRVLDPLSRADLASLGAAPRSSGRLRELEREKQLVLKAIKEVELDYQMRKIAEPDYKEMIERYRARALRLISELEAGDNFRPLIERELRDRIAAADAAPANAATTPAAAQAGACPSCGTHNDDDAQFCKKCGGRLGPS